MWWLRLITALLINPRNLSWAPGLIVWSLVRALCFVIVGAVLAAVASYVLIVDSMWIWARYCEACTLVVRHATEVFGPASAARLKLMLAVLVTVAAVVALRERISAVSHNIQDLERAVEPAARWAQGVAGRLSRLGSRWLADLLRAFNEMSA